MLAMPFGWVLGVMVVSGTGLLESVYLYAFVARPLAWYCKPLNYVRRATGMVGPVTVCRDVAGVAQFFAWHVDKVRSTFALTRH